MKQPGERGPRLLQRSLGQVELEGASVLVDLKALNML